MPHVFRFHPGCQREQGVHLIGAADPAMDSKLHSNVSLTAGTQQLQQQPQPRTPARQAALCKPGRKYHLNPYLSPYIRSDLILSLSF